MKPLGFTLSSDKRHFEHPATDLYIEFPPAPLEFGNRTVQHDQIPRLRTPWGPLRVITSTLCVMDRFAAWWHWKDRESWDQAVMVAKHSSLDYADLRAFAREEGADPADIEKLQRHAENL